MKKAALFLAIGLVGGCLPKDTRPPPSRIRFTATPSAALKADAAPTETTDGWSLSFDRALLSLGRASFDGDGCSVYSEAGYQRVLNLLGAPDAQKISESYALGQCNFGFGISNPGSHSLLGVGATADDLAFLRTPGEDHYAGPSGTTLFVSGTARNGGERLKFAWAFRGRARFSECQTSPQGPSAGFTLEQDGDVALDVTVHLESLFSENPANPSAALRFDPIAEADAQGNQDGEVSLDELAAIPLGALRTTTAYSQAEPSPTVWMTLEDFIYLGAAPATLRFADAGKCNVTLGDARGR